MEKSTSGLWCPRRSACEQRWRTATGASGPLLHVGEHVLGISPGIEEHDPLAVFALAAADGKHTWTTPLGISDAGGYYSDDLWLAHGGEWLIAGYRDKIVALRSSATPTQ